MALDIKNNVFVTIIEKQSVNNKDYYKVIMPTGLVTLRWSEDLIFI